MGRNARRTHNLKNKRGARRDEGGGGARRWSSGESEREREDGGGNGASLCPVSRLVCTSSRSARGVEGGTYPAPRGGVKRARGWAGGAVGSRSGEERRWMYRTVNETMPLTTFGTDNGRECAAGVNEPKVVHRWVGSSPLPRHGWGWVGLARLAINYRSYRAPRFSSGPFVVSLRFRSLFFPSPFSPPRNSGPPNSPAITRNLPIYIYLSSRLLLSSLLLKSSRTKDEELEFSGRSFLSN